MKEIKELLEETKKKYEIIDTKKKTFSVVSHGNKLTEKGKEYKKFLEEEHSYLFKVYGLLTDLIERLGKYYGI